MPKSRIQLMVSLRIWYKAYNAYSHNWRNCFGESVSYKWLCTYYSYYYFFYELVSLSFEEFLLLYSSLTINAQSTNYSYVVFSKMADEVTDVGITPSTTSAISCSANNTSTLDRPSVVVVFWAQVLFLSLSLSWWVCTTTTSSSFHDETQQMRQLSNSYGSMTLPQASIIAWRIVCVPKVDISAVILSISSLSSFSSSLSPSLSCS